MRGVNVLAAAAVAAATACCVLPASASVPFASGDSAANIPVSTADTQLLLRWVPDRTGTVTGLYLHVKVEGAAACPLGGRRGYAAGTTGTLKATTHRILPNGRPDTSSTLATASLNPCNAQQSESVRLPMSLAVEAGDEYGTVISNADGAPTRNYFSVNFLYIAAGIPGANGRNERDPRAADAYMGLDPRELVGYSTDGGASWRLPGGPYGVRSGGGSFIPTYGLVYADGGKGGQPYYYSQRFSGGAAMRVTARAGWTVTSLGAYSSSGGSATLTLEVDGKARGSAKVQGSGVKVAAITPVEVRAGQVLVVRASAGLTLRRMFADAYWDRLLGLGAAWWFSALGSGETRPVSVFPVYTSSAAAGTPNPPGTPPPGPNDPVPPPPPPPPPPTPPATPPVVTLPVPELAAPAANAPRPPAGAPTGRRVIVVRDRAARIVLTCETYPGCRARLVVASPYGRSVYGQRDMQVAPGMSQIGVRLSASVLDRLERRGYVAADLRALGNASWRVPVLLLPEGR